MIRLGKNTRILLHVFAGFGDQDIGLWAEGSSNKLKAQCKPCHNHICNIGVKIIEVDSEAPILVLKFSSGS